MKIYLYNLFSSIKKSQAVNRSFLLINQKKNCEVLLNILWDEGFILGYCKGIKGKVKIFLKYYKNKPVINSVNFISKLNHKKYYSLSQLWKLNYNKYFLIVSTNRGLKTGVNCKKLKIGGEPFLILS